jgi:uncharacterized membrane protein
MNFNKIITDENNVDSTVMIKALLFFYILIGNSLLEPLLSKQWKEMVKDSRMIQHVIGLTTIIALTILVSNGNMPSTSIILYSILGYGWFLISTKMDIHWNIVIIIALLITYLYDNNVHYEQNIVANDKVLTDDEKRKIIESNNTYKLVIVGIIASITVIGTFMYSNRKEVQYGGGYSLVNYLFY